jgi:hypothetical protein
MAPQLPRIIRVAHDSTGRLRLRLSWLHDEPDGAPAIADALVALDGVVEVKVRAYTGSVLVLYDPARVAAGAIGEAAARATGVSRVLGEREEEPAEVRALLERSLAEGDELARTAARAFKEMDVDLLRATGGAVSFGSLLSLGFLGAALSQLFTRGWIALPSWYELAWWSFRSFFTLEEESIETAERGVTAALHPDRLP